MPPRPRLDPDLLRAATPATEEKATGMVEIANGIGQLETNIDTERTARMEAGWENFLFATVCGVAMRPLEL